MKKELTLAYCPIGNGSSIEPFDRVFSKAVSVEHLRDADAVIFWGGTDIPPAYYGQTPHKSSQCKGKPSHRDTFEWRLMTWCKLNNVPMIGVCRGAQMLCAAAGGSLIQDVSGHAYGGHNVITKDGEVFHTNSYHHQMMYPFDISHEMLAWSETRLSRHYYTEDDEEELAMYKQYEPEIVYFPGIRGLAIQGHPEWAVNTRFADFCVDMVKEKLFKSETNVEV